jgi:hypothetical protein
MAAIQGGKDDRVVALANLGAKQSGVGSILFA